MKNSLAHLCYVLSPNEPDFVSQQKEMINGYETPTTKKEALLTRRFFVGQPEYSYHGV